MPLGSPSSDLLVRVIPVLALVTKSAWPIAISAAGKLAPAASAAAGKRSTLLFPTSATQRFPDASNARPARPKPFPLSDNVAAPIPPRFTVLVVKVFCPITMDGNCAVAEFEKGLGNRRMRLLP